MFESYGMAGDLTSAGFLSQRRQVRDLIHAAKPEPDREIPQAQTAHTTFWDYVSLIRESPHMLMWAMSDRAVGV